MSVRILVAAIAAVVQIIAAAIFLVAGPGLSVAFAVQVAVGAAGIGAIWWLLGRRINGALGGLRATIEQMKRDGDLSQRAPSSCCDVGPVATSFNELIATFQSIMGKVYFNSDQVAHSSKQLSGTASSVSDGSAAQKTAAETVTQSIEHMTASIEQIAGHASQAAANAKRSHELSGQGAEIVGRASDEIKRIAHAVEQSAGAIAKLGEASRSIHGIVQTIREIADQTNLLALNAAIEAARAGEQGRGFAVVADEVRKLAERTSLATAEIGTVITTIQTDTESAIALVQSGAGQATQGAEYAQAASEALQAISSGAQETMNKVHAIAGAIAEQTRDGEVVVRQVRSILDLVDSNSSGASQALGQATQLDNLAVNLKEIGTVFKLGDIGDKGLRLHGEMPAVVQKAAADIERTLEAAIKSGRISETELFDENYQPIPHTKPQKFQTRFDKITDELFPPIQEAILDSRKELVYAGAVDRNGYFPTHNKRYSKPLTGDEKIDMVNNRTKRIFTDPVGKRCGSHALPFLIQTYRRDTGEIVHDISAPIMVRGRQWGGFRIGYAT
jgi:methyl-accepting chemotaxis protein